MAHGPYTTTVELLIDGIEHEATVTYTVSPAEPEIRYGECPHPGCPAAVEDIDITINGEPVSDLRYEEIRAQLDEDDLLSEAAEQEQGWAEDAADARREERMRA